MNCVTVAMGFGKDVVSGYLRLIKTLYFRLCFRLFCTWIYIRVPRLTLQRCRDLIRHRSLVSINVGQQMG